jgi:hypothetical protein
MSMTKTNPRSLSDVNAEWHACFVSNGGGYDAGAAADGDDDDNDVDDEESQKGSVID